MMKRRRQWLPAGLAIGLLCSLGSLPASAQEPAKAVDPLTGQVVSGTPAEVTDDTAAEAEFLGPDLTEVNKQIGKANFAEANELLVGLQEEFPDSVTLRVMRGEVLLALGKPDEALTHLKSAAETEPERPRLQFQLASALLSIGETAGAIEAFAREAENNDDPAVKVMAHLNRAMLLQRDHKWDDAAGDLEAVLQIEPTRQEVYGDLAALYVRTGKVDDAVRILDAGFSAGFQSADHFYSLGARVFRDEDFERSVLLFERALTIDPRHAKSERSLGAALEKLGRTEESVVHFKKYLELKPTAADAEKIRSMIAKPTDS